MESGKLFTKFAPAERLSNESIIQDNKLFPKDAPMFNIANSLPAGIIILNNERQIVFANRTFLNLLKLDDDKEVLGKRPGEVLNCVHAFETGGGCGTTEFCRTCGAVKSILLAQAGKENVQECRIIERQFSNAFDFRIWSTPLEYKNRNFTIFAVQDIQDEKRRKIFERIFFHDILNTASGLKGISEIICDADPSDLQEFKEILSGLIERLIDEIKAQRELLAAENNEYQVTPNSVNTISFIQEVIHFYAKSDISRDKKIILGKDSSDTRIITDRILLWRVILNMAKNALEASEPNQTITITCKEEDNSITFSVHSYSFMNEDVRLQVFQRSFSTKGQGRGLGTYSIKLLTEQYLKGKTWFTSNEETGTTFFIQIPSELKS